MTVRFEDRAPGWRPSWAQMLDMIERQCQGNCASQEIQWLREHPADWLFVARYLRRRVENHIGETRKTLKAIVAKDERGRDRPQYLAAKRDAESLNQKRMHWLSYLDEQIEEARYLIGVDSLPWLTRAQVVSSVMEIRHALISELYDDEAALEILDGLLVTLTDGSFEAGSHLPELP